MEYLWFLYFIVSLFFLIWGLSDVLGLGWAIFLIDLLSGGSSNADYYSMQKDKGPAKKKVVRNRGYLFIVIGLCFGLLAIRTLG